MLYQSTIGHPALELLKRLMSDGVMKDFVLVGGVYHPCN
jgi:hypothetical protein